MTGILKCDTIQNSAGAFEHARLVQVVNVMKGTMVTGTTVMLADDTIPQNDEGIELMTLAVTPTHASNKLLIEVVVASLDNGNANYLFTALFQDSTSNALASCGGIHMPADGARNISFSHYMTTGTTSSTTFKVRAGCNGSGTTTFNGRTGATRMGGTLASSITISEIRE